MGFEPKKKNLNCSHVGSRVPFIVNQFLSERLVHRGGDQVVSMLAFYSDNSSSNPDEVYNFVVKLFMKRTI